MDRCFQRKGTTNPGKKVLLSAVGSRASSWLKCCGGVGVYWGACKGELTCWCVVVDGLTKCVCYAGRSLQWMLCYFRQPWPARGCVCARTRACVRVRVRVRVRACVCLYMRVCMCAYLRCCCSNDAPPAHTFTHEPPATASLQHNSQLLHRGKRGRGSLLRCRRLRYCACLSLA